MFKALLIETLPQFKYDPLLLAKSSGVPGDTLRTFLDVNNVATPSAAEFAAIIKALPLSLSQLLPDETLDELSYLDAQLALVESASEDHHQPMFGGMRRLLRRLIHS